MFSNSSERPGKSPYKMRASFSFSNKKAINCMAKITKPDPRAPANETRVCP